MAVGALIAIGVAAVASAGAAIYQGEQQRKAANQAADAQKEQARQAEIRAKEEERIAKEQRDFEIGIAKEQLDFEKKSKKEKAAFTKSQLAKRDAEILAAAIAGSAASGIDINASSSSLAVLNRIKKEAQDVQTEITKDVNTFIEARTMEFEQLRESKNLTFDWFVSRTHRETEWEVTNKYAEAAAYRSKGRAAQVGSYFGAVGSLAGGVSKAYGYGLIG